MVDYRRNLPHSFPPGASVFLTWRLFGSLPSGSPSLGGARSTSTAGAEFKRADARLDRATSGPLWLKEPRFAAVVLDAIQRGASELRHYDLHAYVIMANHVHVLITPKVEVRLLTRALKGVTARAANGILGRTGNRFWQDESFDHWIRNAGQFERIRNYIERNPVTAGLVPEPEQWRWSSAYRAPSV